MGRRHKNKPVKVSVDQNIVFGTTSKCLGSKESIFVEYRGSDCRCAKCYYCYDEDTCSQVPCTKEERKDGKTGYFRLMAELPKEYAFESNGTSIVRRS